MTLDDFFEGAFLNFIQGFEIRRRWNQCTAFCDVILDKLSVENIRWAHGEQAQRTSNGGWLPNLIRERRFQCWERIRFRRTRSWAVFCSKWFSAQPYVRVKTNSKRKGNRDSSCHVTSWHDQNTTTIAVWHEANSLRSTPHYCNRGRKTTNLVFACSNK